MGKEVYCGWLREDTLAAGIAGVEAPPPLRSREGMQEHTGFELEWLAKCSGSLRPNFGAWSVGSVLRESWP
jgi:hypothetical protein